MRFAIYTHVEHVLHDGLIYGYGPYVREMNIWLAYADVVEVVAPNTKRAITPIDLAYQHTNLSFVSIPVFSITSPAAIVKTVFRLPLLFWVIFKSMKKADHIHLRCPGNVGLIACLVQILFPRKKKTAKYAGNWDPKAKQPFTYTIQKWILSNTFLTKNMQVLVYGEWEKSSKNIKPFFTATYKESDKEEISLRKVFLREEACKEFLPVVRFLFVGTLSEGKRPLYAVKLVEALSKKGYKVHLDLFGEGIERKSLASYIRTNGLNDFVVLRGNQESESIKNAYQNSHFLVLPSRSEGWPKVVAEAMFWGCVPLVTPVSCVPYMLDYGRRGVILTLDLKRDVDMLCSCIGKENMYIGMAREGVQWSRKYTLEYFESGIQKFLES